MSKEYENSSAIYNIPLNSNESDVFGICCGRLYNFLHLNSNHGKSTECNSMMLKMHLEIYDSSDFMAEAEEEKHTELKEFYKTASETIQQLEIQIKTLQDALERMENNVIDKTPEVDSCDNATKQSLQQLEEEIAANKSIDRVEKIKKDNIVHKAPDSNSYQQTYDENKLNADKQEHLDLRDNCVYIQRFRCTDTSFDTPFANVRKLAEEMKVQIPDNSIIHIEEVVEFGYYLDYLVYFRDADIKNKFLRNRHHYKYDKYTKSQLRIIDNSDWGIVDLQFKKPCTNLHATVSLEDAFNEVHELAQKVGMQNIKKFIDHIDVSRRYKSNTILSVRFNNERVKNEFLYNLKSLSEINYEVTDKGGHSLDCDNVNNLNVATVGYNIIGVAALIGLSLTTDNCKRICILNSKSIGTFYNEFNITLMVEFSSNHIKKEFLKKYLEFEEIEKKSLFSFVNFYSSPIQISDYEIDSNVIFIKYDKSWPNFSTALSFIGTAKQMGLSLTRYQMDRFIALSKFP